MLHKVEGQREKDIGKGGSLYLQVYSGWKAPLQKSPRQFGHYFLGRGWGEWGCIAYPIPGWFGACLLMVIFTTFRGSKHLTERFMGKSAPQWT